MIFVLAVFASYRITRLITTDDIAQPLRDLWARKFPRDTKPGMLIACPYCVGVYVSGLITLALVASRPEVRHWWALWLLWPGIAGAQSLLSAIDERLNQ